MFQKWIKYTTRPLKLCDGLLPEDKEEAKGKSSKVCPYGRGII